MCGIIICNYMCGTAYYMHCTYMVNVCMHCICFVHESSNIKYKYYYEYKTMKFESTEFLLDHVENTF